MAHPESNGIYKLKHNKLRVKLKVVGSAILKMARYKDCVRLGNGVKYGEAMAIIFNSFCTPAQ